MAEDVRARWEALYRELQDRALTEFVLRARLRLEASGPHPADRPPERRMPPLCRAHPFLPPHPFHGTR